MRAMMYLSEAATVNANDGARNWFTRDLASISSVSRKQNLEYGVTGFLSYFNGFFLQFLEGDRAAVSELTSKIFNDARHNHFTVLLDRSVDSRSFSAWRTRLIGDLRNDTEYRRFLSRFDGQFTTSSQLDSSIFSSFNIEPSLYQECG